MTHEEMQLAFKGGSITFVICVMFVGMWYFHKINKSLDNIKFLGELDRIIFTTYQNHFPSRPIPFIDLCQEHNTRWYVFMAEYIHSTRHIDMSQCVSIVDDLHRVHNLYDLRRHYIHHFAFRHQLKKQKQILFYYHAMMRDHTWLELYEGMHKEWLTVTEGIDRELVDVLSI